ncbi:MAG TPA: zf-HC2 domain-containing protein [Steroidobacteraceae bacterium]|jgi:hypothetical protein
MSDSHVLENASAHGEISLLLPWYINGTLDGLSRQRVDAHLGFCPICRDDLSWERGIFEKIDDQTSINYVPGASLKRLNARLDALQSKVASASSPPHLSRTHIPWRVLAAASVAAVTVTVAVLLVERWAPLGAPTAQPLYHTVTNSSSRSRDEVIRAVFAPSITLLEMQDILDEAQLRIIAGPSEAGVYSLAANSASPVRASLARLRQHSAVRFAEATRSEPEPGDSR